MIDCHVHLAALPDGKNGCYISPKMLNGFVFKGFIKSMGLRLDDPAWTNDTYLVRLVGLLKESRFVKRAVLLAMDGVYAEDGVFNAGETEFLITNDYVFAAAARFPETFRAGVSINPMRRDAVEELERCVAKGAALVKVLPNAQRFNPGDPRFKPYWRAMSRLKIPLLSHIGFEFSLIGKDQSVGDPNRLRHALDEGVTVIAAHGMSLGLVFYEKYWDIFLELAARYPNFFWDASALSLPNRARMLLKIRKRPELHGRMVFGTDYPLQSYAFPALLAGKPGAYWSLRREKNPFDRHYLLLQALGLPVSTPTHGLLE